LQSDGTTILVVSHNLDAITRVCSKALVLHDGSSHFLGAVPEAISRYHELMRVGWDDRVSREKDGTRNSVDPSVEVLGVEVLATDGAQAAYFESGTTMTVRIRVGFRAAVTNPVAGLFVTNQGNQLVYANNCVGMDTGRFEAGAEAVFDIGVALHLPSGTYTVGPWVTSGEDGVEPATGSMQLVYVGGGPRRGLANLGAKYSVTQVDPT
jgi:lipopolysaccharide transport system ATP-binding protein